MELPLTKATCLLFPGRVGSQQHWEHGIAAGVRLQAGLWIQAWQPQEKQAVQAISQGIPGSDMLKLCPVLAASWRHPPHNLFVACVTHACGCMSAVEGHFKDLFNSLMMCDLLGSAECLSTGKEVPSQLVNCKGNQGLFSVFEVLEYLSFRKSRDACNYLLADLH